MSVGHMLNKNRVDSKSMAQRVAQEFYPGELIGLGPGLPSLLPGAVSQDARVTFLADSGALGYRAAGSSDPVHPSPSDSPGRPVDSDGRAVEFLGGGAALSVVEAAAMVRGGHVGTAVLQPAQVAANGDFTHWTTAAIPGLFPPASAVDWAAGAKRVIAMMAHNGSDNSPNIVARSSLPIDGSKSAALIVSDAAVIQVKPGGLVLAELAPGWTVDDVVAATGAPLLVAPDLKEMTFQVPSLPPAGKVYSSGAEAIRDLPSGAVVNIDGFGGPGGMAQYLLVTLRDLGAKDLTIISNTAGIARVMGFGTPPGQEAIDHSILVEAKQMKKVIASYPTSPRASRPNAFELAFQRGELELEVVPQGTLAERLRAGAAGVAAFYTPTGVGTLLAEGKETRVLDGKEYVLETGLAADFCLIRAHKADTLGNLVYKGTSRNFNAVMAAAARTTVVEVDEIVEAGELTPDEIITPGVYVHRIIQRPAGFSAYQPRVDV